MECRVFALAFGPPRPMHQMVLANWEACDSVQFVLLTDCASQWTALIRHEPRIQVVSTSVQDYFARGAAVLGFQDTADLMRIHGDKLFGRMDGWTACGLRGLLHLMFPALTPHTHTGWIDNDVLVDASGLRQHLFRSADTDLVLFTKAGMLFEQFKIVHTRVDAAAIYHDLLRAHDIDADAVPMPMEARYVYRLRGVRALSRDELPPERIAAHWLHTDESEGGAQFRRHVSVSDDWQLLDVVEGRRLLFLLADSEVKYMPATGARVMLYVHADVMRKAFSK